MWIGWLEFDVLLGDVHSRKEKRSVVRPIVAELQRRFSVSAAETGWLDLHRRAGIGVAAVCADRAHVVEVLDAAERHVESAGHPYGHVRLHLDNVCARRVAALPQRPGGTGNRRRLPRSAGRDGRR